MVLFRKIADGVLRVAATSAHAVLRAFWFVSRPKTFGAHAVALTPEGRLVLVKLRYAAGWRIPGGGRSPDEDPAEAALRELREEIGMVSHGKVQAARDFDEAPAFKRDTASLVIVRDVRYRPARWNWEVEKICEAQPGSLPADTSEMTRRWIQAVLPLI